MKKLLILTFIIVNSIICQSQNEPDFNKQNQPYVFFNGVASDRLIVSRDFVLRLDSLQLFDSAYQIKSFSFQPEIKGDIVEFGSNSNALTTRMKYFLSVSSISKFWFDNFVIICIETGELIKPRFECVTIYIID